MAAWKGPSGASTRRAWDERIAGQWERPRVLTWHHPRASSLKMLGLSLWEGRLPGQKTIENEDKAAMGSYRPESNFGTSDTVVSAGVHTCTVWLGRANTADGADWWTLKCLVFVPCSFSKVSCDHHTMGPPITHTKLAHLCRQCGKRLN